MTARTSRWGGRTTVVTGANGFVGSHLARALVALGARVTAVVRPTADLWRLSDVVDDVRVVRAELTELAADHLVREIGEAETVYHLAAAGTNQADHDARLMLDANVLGTFRVMEMAQRVGARRLVCAGTGFEYGVVSQASESGELRPITAYAATKAAASLIAQACAPIFGMSVVTLRTFSVYGPGQARFFVIPYAIVRALTRRPIQLTGATQLRDFLFVDDAVRAYLRVGEIEPAPSEIYNIGSGREISIRDVVSAIVSLSASPSEVIVGARPYSARELWGSSANIEKARLQLQWAPEVTLEDGLTRTIEWHASNLDLYESKYPEHEA